MSHWVTSLEGSTVVISKIFLAEFTMDCTAVCRHEEGSLLGKH